MDNRQFEASLHAPSVVRVQLRTNIYSRVGSGRPVGEVELTDKAASMGTAPIREQGVARFDDATGLTEWNSAFATAVSTLKLHLGMGFGEVIAHIASTANGPRGGTPDPRGGSLVTLAHSRTYRYDTHILTQGERLIILTETLSSETPVGLAPSRRNEPSESQLQALIEHAPLLVSAKDLQGKITLLGSAFSAVLENPAAYIGRNIFDVFPKHVADPMWTTELRAQERPIEVEEVVPHADGTVHTYLTQKFPLRDAAGQVCGTASIGMDISKRKDAERERDALQQQVRHAQRLESVGVLTSGIAHDFNNLLAVIYGAVEVATRQLSQANIDTTVIRGASQAARRASELIKQMLTYAGKTQATMSMQQVNDAIRGVAQLLDTSISKKAKLELKLQSALPPILGNGSQLGQVVMNLVTNAAEAVGDGEGTITLATGLVHCDEALLDRLRPDQKLPPGEYVCISVSDTGPGMDAATLDKIFEPFFSTKFTGRGLGLAIVHGIVRSHDAALEVQSERGQGTTVRVYLPPGRLLGVKAGQAPTRSTRRQRRKLASRARSIMIADDEGSVRQVATAMVKALGFDVVLADDGQEAVERLRECSNEVAAVLMDLHMPRMNGAEAVAALNEAGVHVPCILTSGNPGDLDASWREKGFAGRLDKPYSLKELARTLTDVGLSVSDAPSAD